MRSLKEVYGLTNQKILKEEIDFSSNKATVYHLCGKKVGVPDPFQSLETTNARGRVTDWNTYHGGSPGQTGGDVTATDRVYKNLQATRPHLFEPDEDTKSPEIRRDKSRRASAIKRNLERGAAKKYYESINTIQGKAYTLARSVMTNPYSTGSNFMAGMGATYGKGLYTCYEFNPKIAQTYGDVILRFEVDVSNFMIFTEENAKGIHGENYRLEDQFRTIIERKGYDYNKLVSDPKIAEFIDYLKKTSAQDWAEGQYVGAGFIGSKGSNRTAGVCIDILQKLSILTENKILLRSLIEGVIFHGDHDGPVCIIYHPEIASNYILTGAGYFHPETKKPIIYDDIEKLAGRKSSVQLKDYIKIQQDELESDDRQLALEKQKQKNDKKIDVYLNKVSEVEDTSEIEEAFNKIHDIIKNKIMFSEEIGQEVGKRIIELRDELSGNQVLESAAEILAHFLYGLRTLPSEILSPVIDALEIISGKKVQIMSSDEFIGYLSNLRNMKIRRKRKLESIEDLKAAYEGFTPGATVSGVSGNAKQIDLSFPLNEDPNISKQDLEKVWNAIFYLQTLNRTDVGTSKILSNAIQRMIALSEIMDGDDNNSCLDLFNIKPKVPISYLTIDFLLGKSYPVSVWHEHLVKIENEGVDKLSDFLKEIHDILASDREFLDTFNSAAEDNGKMYETPRLKEFDSSSPADAFGLGAFASEISWPSQFINIPATLAYLYAMNGTSKIITDAIDAGFTKIVVDFDMMKLLETLGIHQTAFPGLMPDIFEHDDGDSIFIWNTSNKQKTIKELTEMIKGDLKADMAYNIFSTMEMSLEVFFDKIATTAGISLSGRGNQSIQI
tara:strand:+ start:6094 stop:8607 length:2514 start_codon:yes stop_codon:yes gene_type:complete